jgi:hypothetical protein
MTERPPWWRWRARRAFDDDEADSELEGLLQMAYIQGRVDLAYELEAQQGIPLDTRQRMSERYERGGLDS